MTYDKIEEFGNSQYQHGKYNDRIYLMKLVKSDFPQIIPFLEEKAEAENYSKIFAKVPQYAEAEFAGHGFVREAAIPRFYNGEADAVFLGKYFTEKRAKPANRELIADVLKTAQSKAGSHGSVKLPDGYRYRICEKKDAEQMARVYKKVFETYPFPIHDPEYLKETMDSHVIYFGVWDGEKLAALSSSETDAKNRNAEMTDFATLPEYRGAGLAVFLLGKMEAEMRRRGFKTAYTIARAVSYGMNITFAKMGYRFAGTLKNNTNISGKMESMNVWHKPL